MLKHILTYYIISFAIFTFAQKANVKLEISPINPQVGETFIVTVSSNVQGSLEIDNLPSSYIQDYSVRQGSSQTMDHSTGIIETLFYTSYSGVISKSGKYKIGPAYVKHGNKAYPSNTITINVGSQIKMNASAISAQQMKDPAFGVIEINKTEIYEGEPILVASKIYSRFEPDQISSYQSYPLNGTVLKHPVGNASNIKIAQENYKGHDFYTFSYDKNIIFPEGVGNFPIEPFKLNLHQAHKAFPLMSSSSIVLIKSLPSNPPADFIGGVGEFSITQNIETSSIKQGEVFKLIVTIVGVGNLHSISEPVLNLPKGFIIYGDPIINEDYTIGIHGADGEISYEYNIQVSKFGRQKIPGTSISYFNLKDEKYTQVETGEIEILIEKSKNYIEPKNDSKESKTEVVSDQLNNDNDSGNSEEEFYESPIFWAGITLPILSILFFFVFIKKRKENAEKPLPENPVVVKTNSKSIPELINDAKEYIDSNKDDLFFLSIEKILRKEFEPDTNTSTERFATNLEIIDHINNEELKSEVASLFNICEKSRYGIASPTDSKQSLLNRVVKITNYQ